jgi:hypothetical protein
MAWENFDIGLKLWGLFPPGECDRKKFTIAEREKLLKSGYVFFGLLRLTEGLPKEIFFKSRI